VVTFPDLLKKLISSSGIEDIIAAVRSRAETVRTPTWWTPWSWVDSGGLYVGDAGGWLYRELPIHMLADDGAAVGAMMDALCQKLAGREVHLLMHRWSAPAEAAGSSRLAGYLQETLELFVPQTCLLVGVSVQRDQAEQRPVDRHVLVPVDDLLGESVPDLDLFDRDRSVIDAVLAAFHATVPQGQTRDLLEQWYALGAATDLVVEELDDVVKLPGAATAAFVSVADLADEDAPAGGLPAPGYGDAMVWSLRAELTASEMRSPSVVIGRRSVPRRPWPETVSDALGEGLVQPLPLRQLPALDETLPCSAHRTNSLPASASGSDLSRWGLRDPRPVGDPDGLFVGMSGADGLDLTFWDPFTEPGSWATVDGQARSGRTFVAEHLAWQAHLDGACVRWLSGDGESGRPLAQRDDVAAIAHPAPGLADPGRGHDEQTWAALASQLAALFDVADDEQDAFRWAAQRRTARQHPCASDLPGLVAQQQLSQRLSDLVARRGTGAWLAAGRVDMPVPAGSSAWAVPAILDGVSPDKRAVVADLLCARAVLAATESSRLLVVADSVTPGPVTSAALAQVRAAGAKVSLLVVGADCGALTMPASMSLHARGSVSEEGLAAAPLVEGAVVWPSMLRMVDRAGRSDQVVVAPVNDQLLGPLSRVEGARYPDARS